MSFLTNKQGFFQEGKSFGGRGLFGKDGVLSGFANKFKDKPYAGIPGVCPYTGKPLQTPTEQATGVSDEVTQSMAGRASITQNKPQFSLMGGQEAPKLMGGLQ